MHDVAQGVPGFEQTRALNDDNRPAPAQEQAGGHGHGFAFSANADHLDIPAGTQGRFPRAELAVGDPDDVRDSALFQSRNNARTIEHAGLPMTEVHQKQKYGGHSSLSITLTACIASEMGAV